MKGRDMKKFLMSLMMVGGFIGLQGIEPKSNFDKFFEAFMDLEWEESLQLAKKLSHAEVNQVFEVKSLKFTPLSFVIIHLDSSLNIKYQIAKVLLVKRSKC